MLANYNPPCDNWKPLARSRDRAVRRTSMCGSVLRVGNAPFPNMAGGRRAAGHALKVAGHKNRASFKILESSANRPTEVHQTQNETHDLTRTCPVPLTWLVVVWGMVWRAPAPSPPPAAPALSGGGAASTRSWEPRKRSMPLCSTKGDTRTVCMHLTVDGV